MWPFNKDIRPDWVSGRGYLIRVPEQTTDEDVARFFGWYLREMIACCASSGGDMMWIPRRVWMTPEEYEACAYKDWFVKDE